jgi:plastocyanin domain-containing protein
MTIRGWALVILLACSACSRDEAAPAAAAPATQAVQDGRATITVEADGYHPSSLTVTAGTPLTLTFKRTTTDLCGAEVAFPALGIRKELPLNQPVDVQLTPTAGTIAFTCGMDMMRGTIVAR